MANCILIADSGSTKTDWILAQPQNGILEYRTSGINPVRDSQNTIFLCLKNELLSQIPEHTEIQEVWFYGAGCVDPFRQQVCDAFRQLLPDAEIHVESDLLGAAIALHGNQPGIACILGTGSNSCLYDGQRIVANTSPLGFILGDEGSGSYLGKTLVGLLYKGMLPAALLHDFEEYFHINRAEVIDRVYRQPQPNRFLASLVPFIQLHREEPGVHTMIVDAFRAFYIKNVRAYGHHDSSLGFVGSIAKIYREELEEAARIEGFKIGKILQRPILEIANFHQNNHET